MKKYIFSTIIIIVTLTFTVYSNYSLIHQLYHLINGNNYVHNLVHYDTDNSIIENSDTYNYSNLNNYSVLNKFNFINSYIIQKCNFDNFVLNNKQYFDYTKSDDQIFNLKGLEFFNYYKSLNIKTILRVNSNKAPPIVEFYPIA